MTLCPVALLASCKSCPIFSICPVKSVIGDYNPKEAGTKQEKDKSGSDPKGND